MPRVGLLLLLCVCAAKVRAGEFDLVVYGGTSGGVAAAVQARRMGKSVVLIEPSRHIGGLTSGGLGATDIGNKAAIGGIAREFYQRVKQHYQHDAAWQWEKRKDYAEGRQREGEDAMWTFEPRVAEAILRAMLGEAGVEVVEGERLDRDRGVNKSAARIESIATESGREFRGRTFIDATYEGDLMAAAGVTYIVGREANRQHDETLNGVQAKNAVHHQFIKPVDPYLAPGDPESGLLPGIESGGPGQDGEGDARVQAYCFRLCATDKPENRRPWPKPKDYDERRYELLLRNFEAGDHRIPWNPILMPNRKTDSNNNYAVSTDYLGANYAYPDGSYAVRERIIADHESYQKGLMWTLANHPRVPEKVREHFQTWGLAKDEFTDNDNWPHQLYVREARRMVSAYVMTQHDCQGRRAAEDAVGLAAYTMDSHNVRRYVDAAGHARNEGDVQVGGFAPYPISYRCLVPLRKECENLLVPVCLSASHIAYGSIRMEPVFMVLGQSAATATCLAIDAGVSIQEVEFAALKQRLLDDGQVLEWTGPRPPAGIEAKKLPGIVVDDREAKLTGDWTRSSAIGGFVGDGYLHDNNEDRGEKSARFTPRLPKAGKYEVRISWTANPNRATNVPVLIQSADGERSAKIDQTQPPGDEGQVFRSLGTFRFDAGEAGWVEIQTAAATGYVILDAVQWLPVE